MTIEQTRLVDELKDQTFGTEVEMYHITRQTAANVAARYFGTHTTRHDGDTYDTWVAVDGQGREWKFMYDGSIIASRPTEKCEMVTPILRYSDLELLQGLIRELRHAHAKSDPSHQCGVHVHIGADGQDAKSVRMLSNLMASHESAIITALGLDQERLDRWCRPTDKDYISTLDKARPQSLNQLADVWYETHGTGLQRSAHYNSSRYHMLNLHSLFTKGTVEFRMFQFDDPTEDRNGGLHAGQLKAFIQFALGICARAKRCKSARPDDKTLNAPNPVNAMRLWLGSLGLLGPEFNTCRAFFTRGLKRVLEARRAA